MFCIGDSSLFNIKRNRHEMKGNKNSIINYMNDLQFDPARASKASFIGACLTKYGSSLSHIFHIK